MSVVDVVHEAEVSGVAFRLDGEKIRIWYPDYERREWLAPRIALLRGQRAEVVAYLKTRNTVPPMPEGIRLVRWELKPAPIALTRVEVVTDVPRFVAVTLLDLRAGLAGKRWLAGHRSVRDLIERLEECGVVVEVNEATR